MKQGSAVKPALVSVEAWGGGGGLGFRVQGSGFRVSGSGFRVWGLGFGSPGV